MNSQASAAALDVWARPVIAALRLTELPEREHADAPRAAVPFVTISRQAGTDGTRLAQRLVERLREVDPDPQRPWTCWDRELVERVAADQHISQEMIDSLEDSHRTWLEEFFANLSFEEAEVSDELAIYRRVAATIRALAQVGRIVVVGRGGVCVTRNMPRGTHVRLVAPLKQRIAITMRKFNVSQNEAAEQVRKLDHNRELFYRRYWPAHPLAAEMFTVTLNTANVTEEQAAECLLPLIVPQVICCRARAGGERRCQSSP